MKRRSKIIWITIGVIFLGLMIPGLLNRNIARRNQFSTEEVSLVNDLVAELEAAHESPADMLIRFFKEYDIVFLGEMPKIANHTNFLMQNLKTLHEAGIRDIGFQYVLYRDQAELDRIITAEEFDTDAAKQLLYNYMVIWGYQEYLYVIRSVWSINSNLEEGMEKMRLVGLSPYQDYTHIEVEEDVQDPEILKLVQPEGIPDIFMADVIEREFGDKGKKALIYTDSKHIFTTYELKSYTALAESLDLPETRRAGGLCLDRGIPTAAVMLHTFWPDQEARIGLDYPVNGVLDRVLQVAPSKYRTAGIDLRESLFGDLRIEKGLYTDGYPALKFSDLWDGYIFIGRVQSYRGTTAISKFITNANFQETLDNFPGPKIVDEKVSVKDLNTFIKRSGEQMTSIVQTF